MTGLAIGSQPSASPLVLVIELWDTIALGPEVRLFGICLDPFQSDQLLKQAAEGSYRLSRVFF